MDATGACIIVGGGLAGLSTALALAPMPAIVLSKAPLGLEASSVLAQGGVAASLGPDDDVALHLADTLKAGDGLCDAAVAHSILSAAPAAIEELIRYGAPFDRDAEGRLVLGLEAAHSRRRIVHAGGDGSGREIMRALVERVRNTPTITVIEGISAHRLIVEDNAVTGVVAEAETGPVLFASNHIVIATGGVGGLYQYGTNPAGSFGQGLALAARAGAVMADLEFVQFHPTALDSDSFPLKLISETVRGEGAILIDETGRRFMAGKPGAELAPRDIVARAVFAQLAAGHRVFLDAREAVGAGFAQRFPAITSFCQAAGVDPATQPIPIRPAAHYHMGGVNVDLMGRTSVEGLWACGEAACTGLHGANRLASNSLLEAVVCGGFVAESVASTSPVRRRKVHCDLQPIVPDDPAPVRQIMTRAVGVLRDGEGLREAVGTLFALARDHRAASDAAIVGLMIAVAALRRNESRGAHARTDFPCPAATPQRSTLQLEEAMRAAEALVPELVD
ncbi:L-aspartate oxidase [Methylocella tundrae]|uniref:L-aspartate oxidase n=1 Tax=Methylocella tundrae TaxID=227605 RepID=A0A8B6MAL8_METTU|nr:L-aspartate oxidase [Methylocella tundrae]VTZ51565.1 L-aspartate oxidase [Methylocella tundrae]